MAVKKYYVTVDNSGATRWYKDAECKVLHRTDGPAIEWSNGDKRWYIDGQLNRIDGPCR